jgi:hypothetical protein
VPYKISLTINNRKIIRLITTYAKLSIPNTSTNLYAVIFLNQFENDLLLTFLHFVQNKRN